MAMEITAEDTDYAENADWEGLRWRAVRLVALGVTAGQCKGSVLIAQAFLLSRVELPGEHLQSSLPLRLHIERSSYRLG